MTSGTPKYRRLADSLIADISGGRYKPGEQLPSMRTLRDEWGERTVHEAMRVLKTEGWIQTTVGTGTFVAEALPAPPVDVLEERIAALEASSSEDRARIDRLDRELRELRSWLPAKPASNRRTG